jgi:hypothetical protein
MASGQKRLGPAMVYIPPYQPVSIQVFDVIAGLSEQA